MALYAIGDLHLGSSVDKPMDVFGEAWLQHPEQIEASWRERITENDSICVPGDISWAMTLEEAVPDLRWISQLPGHKMLIRGNHDYWWNGIQKVRQQLNDTVDAIQNDCVSCPDYCIAGTRGWLLPSHPSFTDDDSRVLQREVHRLQLSLDAAKRTGLPIICMLHYPPIDPGHTTPIFSDVLESYGVTVCLYGHLHGAGHRFAVNENIRGVRYQLVSSDYLRFRPLLIPEEWYKS